VGSSDSRARILATSPAEQADNMEDAASADGPAAASVMAKGTFFLCAVSLKIIYI